MKYPGNGMRGLARGRRSCSDVQPGEVGHHEVGAVPPEFHRLAGAVDADDQGEPAGPAGLDAADRILEDHSPVGFSAEALGRGEEEVGSRDRTSTRLNSSN